MNLSIIYNWRLIKDDAGLFPPPHSKKVAGSNLDLETCCVQLTRFFCLFVCFLSMSICVNKQALSYWACDELSHPIFHLQTTVLDCSEPATMWAEWP